MANGLKYQLNKTGDLRAILELEKEHMYGVQM